MSLPAVPDGVNPWTVYQAALMDTLYKNPPSSLRARLIVLFICNGVTMLLAVAFLALLVREAKDKGSVRKGMWVFRLATKRSGSYITTNTKLVCGACTGAVNFGYLWDCWMVFIDRSPQRHSAGFRSMGFIPLFLQGWLVTWGSLQAFLLTTDTQGRNLLSPLVANCLFVVLGSALLLGSIAAASVNVVAGNRLWSEFAVIITKMKDYESTWTEGTSTLPQLLTLKANLDRVTALYERSRVTNLVQLSVMTLVPVIVIAVNAGSLRLAALIRRQISFNIDQVTRPSGGTDTSWTMRTLKTVEKDDKRRASLDVVAALENAAEKRPSVGDKRASVDKRGSTGGRSSVGKSHLSRDDMKYLASRRGSEQDRERLKHIQALQKAETDLVVIAAIIMMALAIVVGLCIYVLVLTSSNQLATASWPKFELALFGTQYVYAVALSSVFIGLLYNAWSSRRVNAATDTIFNNTQINTTMNSALGIHPNESVLSVDYDRPPIPAKDFSYQWPARETAVEERKDHVEVDMEQLEDDSMSGGAMQRRDSDSMVDAAYAAQRRRPSCDFDLRQ